MFGARLGRRATRRRRRCRSSRASRSRAAAAAAGARRARDPRAVAAARAASTPRASSPAWCSRAILLFTALASRELSGRSYRWVPVLILIGSIGLWDRAHALSPELGLTAGVAVALYGFALALRRPIAGGVVARRSARRSRSAATDSPGSRGSRSPARSCRSPAPPGARAPTA